MALLPPVAKRGKENNSDDNFEPLKKHPKLKDVEGIFPQSSISYYINFNTSVHVLVVHCSTVLYTATLLCISILYDSFFQMQSL